MRRKILGLSWGLVAMMCSFVVSGFAQDSSNAVGTASSTAVLNSAVPSLVNYSGVLKDANGKPLTSITGVTFLLYKEETGGAPVWIETQNISPDKNGKYTVTLGATKSDGSLADSFSNGQAHWLGVQVASEQEQPRVLLVAVPYALKAGDAETIGGLPASAFVLANTNKSGPIASGGTKAAGSGTKNSLPPVNPAVTGKGVVNFVPMWDTTSDIVDSVIFQKASEIGIGTTAPAALLDLNGKGDVRDTLTLFPKSTDNTLAVSGSSFKIDSTGKVTFISGQTFPGTGTITGVTTAAASGLAGGGTTGTLSLKIANGGVINTMLHHSSLTVTPGTGLTGGGLVSLGGTTTLNVDTSKIPLLSSNNSFTGNLSTSGTVSAALASFSSTNNSGPVVYANNGGSGDGMDVSTASGVGMLAQSGSFDGAAAFANSTGGWGVFAEANGDANFETGVAGFEYGSTQENVGVWGYTASPHGIGSYAEGYSSSSEGTVCCAGLYSIGMWADSSGTSASNAGIAALTTVDTGYSIVSYSKSSYPTVWLENDVSTDSTAPVLITDGGAVGGVCIFDVSGNLTCSGSITPAVPVSNGTKKVALYGMEAAENWFEDAGAGQLTNGSAVIHLDQTFAETVNTHMDYHVFLTPSGDCRGLYVSQKSPTSFEVHELGGGTSSIGFDYRIMAKRRGYETARLEDRTAQFSARAPAKRAGGARGLSPDAVRAEHVKKDEDARRAVAMVKPVGIKSVKK